MVITKIVGAQRDFSFGEIDPEFKRADEHPAFKAGLRRMQNARILTSKKLQNRPGRTALYPSPGIWFRTDRVTVSPGNVFDFQFGVGAMRIVDSTGAIVAAFTHQGNGNTLPWATTADVYVIVTAVIGLNIYVTFTGMRPQVITWDGASTWTIGDYVEAVLGGFQKRTLFYRISPQNIILTPSAQTGSVTVVASSAVFTPAWVGINIRYVGRQMKVTGYTSPTQITCLVNESLPGSQVITFATAITGTYQIGDEVSGGTSGSKGLITGLNGGANQITVQLLTTGVSAAGVNSGDANVPSGSLLAFITPEIVGGPGGGLSSSAVSVVGAPSGCGVWDEEVMNALHGYPSSCFVDQFRLGFTDFPSIGGAIAWSAINSPTDLYVTALPSGAIFNIAPDKVQIFYVVPGPESSEFVFCDKKIYYIKIDAATPLVPGSVSFQTLSGDGAAKVQPRTAQDVIFYVRAGGKSVMAVVAPGAYYRPFNTRIVSHYSNHLFKPGIIALAAPNADSTFIERYLYVLNTDSTVAVARYEITDGVISDNVGWGLWASTAPATWISANDSDVIFTSTFSGNNTFVEKVDDSQYVDGAILVNSAPAAFAPPAGMGPLWFIASQSATLIDQGTRFMGTYRIDASGFIIPQNNGGENLASATLIAGQPWTMVIEPFPPDANPGNSVHQRMFKRRISRMAVAVMNSTGFVLARLFSGPITQVSQANNIPLGTIMNNRRITAWNQDDDPTKPPPLREEVQRWRPLGRSYDPRVAIIKDTPGPLLIAEIGLEVSI